MCRAAWHGVAPARFPQALPTLRTMTAMVSGVILVTAFGLVGVAGVVLAVALYRVSGRRAASRDRGR